MFGGVAGLMGVIPSARPYLAVCRFWFNDLNACVAANVRTALVRIEAGSPDT